MFSFVDITIFVIAGYRKSPLAIESPPLNYKTIKQIYEEDSEDDDFKTPLDTPPKSGEVTPPLPQV